MKKRVNFKEAFKNYKEGKEVESVRDRFKMINGEHCYWDETTQNWDSSCGDYLGFSIKEIENEWYIND